MSAGTIKLTNGSTAVVGTGTAFTSDLKSGDVITATVGGIFFTLFVDAVTSNTALTLTDPFTGPTTSGLAWVAVPQLALNRITAALAAQTAESVRRVLQENANWQAFYTGTGDITVTLPDGTPAGRQVAGPSWLKMSGLVSSALQWRGALPSTNLNTFGPTPASAGQWSVVFTGALISEGFPEYGAQGIVEVFNGGPYGGSQRFTTAAGNIYYRHLSAPWNGTDGPWGDWQLSGVNTRPGIFSGDLNSLTTPGPWMIGDGASGTLNAPLAPGQTASSPGICEIILRDTNKQLVQRFTAISTTAANMNRTWQRTLSLNTWSAWELLGTKVLNDLGLGLTSQPIASVFDWQQADFYSGQAVVALTTDWANPPSGLTDWPTGYRVSLNVLYAASSVILVLVTPNASATAQQKIRLVRITGAKGNRAFNTYTFFSDNLTVPLTNGGTGATTAAAARTALELKTGATLDAATTQEVAAGVAAKLVTVPGLTALFDLAATALNGSIRIPNRPGGIIIAWGTAPAGGDGTFVTAFNSPPFVIPQLASGGGVGATDPSHVIVQNTTNTGFSTLTQTLARKYIAIGK